MNQRHSDVPPVMADVQAIMNQLRPPKNANPRILAINQRAMQTAKQNGYPKHLYHANLDPVLALTEDQEEELMQLGYQPHYIRHDYPKMLYRRNMDPKLGPQIDKSTGKVANNPFIEEVMVRSKEAEDSLMKAKIPNGCGQWYARFVDVPELPEGPAEDPAVTIARLEGEVSALRSKGKEKAA